MRSWEGSDEEPSLERLRALRADVARELLAAMPNSDAAAALRAQLARIDERIASAGSEPAAGGGPPGSSDHPTTDGPPAGG